MTEMKCSQFTEIIQDLQIVQDDDYKQNKYETDINNYNGDYKMFALVGYRKKIDNDTILNDIFIIDGDVTFTITENNENNYSIDENTVINMETITFKLLGEDNNVNISKCDLNYIKGYTGTLFLSFHKNITFNTHLDNNNPIIVNNNTFKSKSIFFRLSKTSDNKIKPQVNTATVKDGTENVYISGGNINDENENQNNDDNDNELNNQLIEGGSDKLLNKVYDNNNSNNNLNNKRHSFKRKKITNS